MSTDKCKVCGVKLDCGYLCDDCDSEKQWKMSTNSLQAFDSDRGLICTFESPELTALCPFDFGGPDYYELTIKYETCNCTVESKSLKNFLQSYRNTEISAEDLAYEIHSHVSDCINPTRCYVRLEQARRGGVEEIVEVGNVTLK